MNRNILVVDDDSSAVELLSRVTALPGCKVFAARTGQEAIERGKEINFDVVITDLKMEVVDGMEVLRQFKKFSPDTLVIVVTAFGSIETAINAIREGAYDYISKPFKVDEVQVIVERALDRRRLLEENKEFREKLQGKYRFENIIGNSNEMVDVYKTVARVSRASSSVLIQGESGTGKELIARAIHFNGPRANFPFVAINCSSLPENLEESELFGHVRGSFTGAVADKQGLFELAHKGTCFLDEVSDLSPSTQAKLLRVLQEHEIRRVGSNENIKVDVRIISATNRNLEKDIEDSRFREDLYFRLNVVSINLPPLRERKEDIPLLANYFLAKYNAKTGKEHSMISKAAMERLESYAWPGNVRELENVIERAVSLSTSDVILAEDLPPKLAPSPSNGQSRTIMAVLPEPLTLDALKERYIQEVLQYAGGDKERAKEILGISRASLYNQLGAKRKTRKPVHN